MSSPEVHEQRQDAGEKNGSHTDDRERVVEDVALGEKEVDKGSGCHEAHCLPIANTSTRRQSWHVQFVTRSHKCLQAQQCYGWHHTHASSFRSNVQPRYWQICVGRLGG